MDISKGSIDTTTLTARASHEGHRPAALLPRIRLGGEGVAYTYMCIYIYTHINIGVYTVYIYMTYIYICIHIYKKDPMGTVGYDDSLLI